MTAELPIEKVGARLREMMPWIKRNRLVDTSASRVARLPHPLIAREGWLFVLIALAAALGVGFLVGWWWSIPVWLAALSSCSSSAIRRATCRRIPARCCRPPTAAWSK